MRPRACALLLLAACSRNPSFDSLPIERLLVRLTEPNDGSAQHGRFHRAEDSLQRDLWKRISEVPPGAARGDELLLAAVEDVYTRYDENYFNGLLYHWPYLCSERAVALCDRILSEHPTSQSVERALWLKAFALRVPAVDPWPESERRLETYALQARWKPDPASARSVLRRLAQDFPDGPYAESARRLAEQPDLGLQLPKGPKEKDPRRP